MTFAVLTPNAISTPVDLSRSAFRKQILPLGSINYKGRTIAFTREYLADLAASFKKAAFDQVPFVLADQDNRHTMDPERFRGEVRGMELTNTGLDAIIEFPDEASAAAVRSNPNLGVSARIVEGMTRADGKSFPRAIQHVLGTLDPRVNGLQPWQAVNLSGYNSDIQVVDLTAEAYQEVTVPPTTEKPEPDTVDDLTDEEVMAILASVADDDDDPEDLDEPAVEPELAGASLSADDRKAIDLANSRADTAAEQVRELRQQMATERFGFERDRLISAGCPPYYVELARPILEQPDSVVIDLANSDGATADATALIRTLLGGLAGTVDLAVEKGTSEADPQATADEQALTRWPEG